MRTTNLPASVAKMSECGLMWEEKMTNAVGSIEVPKYSTLRVRAAGATTVTMDGVLAATMMANEIMFFNTGSGDNSDTKRTVTITIAAANAWVQVGREVDKPPREDLI
jgi:hypothetical protein